MSNFIELTTDLYCFKRNKPNLLPFYKYNFVTYIIRIAINKFWPEHDKIDHQSPVISNIRNYWTSFSNYVHLYTLCPI